jgi:hypothetical protein
MGADHGTLAALDTDGLIPFGDLLGYVALLVLGGSGGEGAVVGQLAYLDLVAPGGDYLAQDFLDEGGASAGTGLIILCLLSAAPTLTSLTSDRARSMASMFLATMSAPLRA